MPVQLKEQNDHPQTKEGKRYKIWNMYYDTSQIRGGRQAIYTANTTNTTTVHPTSNGRVYIGSSGSPVSFFSVVPPVTSPAATAAAFTAAAAAAATAAAVAATLSSAAAARVPVLLCPGRWSSNESTSLIAIVFMMDPLTVDLRAFLKSSRSLSLSLSDLPARSREKF